MTVPEVSRPVVRWHGGKWKLAPWIITHLPPHRIYVEPFGGGGSVLMRKARSYAEVYNDLDDDIVNLFRVLRGPRAQELIDALRLTPFARTEFLNAYDPTDDQLERARRLVIRSFMGFGSNGHNIAVKTGFRSNANRSGTTPAHDWANYPDALAGIIERLEGVVVEHKDAVECMRQHDSAETLHYVDPPYLFSTRSLANPYDLKYRGGKGTAHRGAMYAHEMTDDDHLALLTALRELVGMVVLSGYPSALYDATLADWRRVETAAHADGARPRIEVLWLNEAAAHELEAGHSQQRLAL